MNAPGALCGLGDLDPVGPPEVPERYRGVWQRSLLQTPTSRDTSTWVRWLQTGSWHADLRVPTSARPPQGVAPLPSQLATQQGFLGRTRVTPAGPGGPGEQSGPDLPEVCAWERQLDFQPPGTSPDAGHIDFETPTRLIETGIHGTYLEHWECLPDSLGRHAVLERRLGSTVEWLLLSGAYLMRVRPRADAWPTDTAPGDSLCTVLLRHPAQQAALLDFEISFGCLSEGCWIVEKSTQPGLEGTVHPLQLRRMGENEAAVSQGRSLGGASRWRVHEWSERADVLR